jgi:glycosyltransferase involved in cell wall biosynthesis
MNSLLCERENLGSPMDGRARTSGVSVIICAFNSASRLPKTLNALKTQLVPPGGWDLIVVDNASDDDTVRVCREKWAGSDISMNLVREERPGLSYARHAGISISSREYFCFVDDDNHLCPDYLAEALEIMETHGDIGVLGGLGLPVTDGNVPAWIWKGWQSHAVGPQGANEGYVDNGRGFVYGAGMVVRRKAWDELADAGFESVLSDRSGKALSSGGDVEMCFALRILDWKIYYSPRLSFSHFMPADRLSWDYCQRLFSAYGHANSILELYGLWLAEGHKAILKQSLPGLIVYELLELNRLRARLKGGTANEEGSIDRLRACEAHGKSEAIWNNLRTGRILGLRRHISRFAIRARGLR